MPEMKSMKLSKKESKEAIGEAVPPEEPSFPYGLNFHLEDEVLKKLGMSELPDVGAEMLITARAKVESVRQSESQEGGEDRSVSLQITNMGVFKESKLTDLEKKLYKSPSDEGSSGESRAKRKRRKRR